MNTLRVGDAVLDAKTQQFGVITETGTLCSHAAYAFVRWIAGSCERFTHYNGADCIFSAASGDEWTLERLTKIG